MDSRNNISNRGGRSSNTNNKANHNNNISNRGNRNTNNRGIPGEATEYDEEDEIPF